MLVVTNAESGRDAVVDVVDGADVLPWNDVLHDGPVWAGQDLARVSRGRASFLAEAYGSESGERDINAEFVSRDATLLACLETQSELVLWFESDLYDQLQLAQVLYLARNYGGWDANIVPWSGQLHRGDLRLRGAYDQRRPLARDELEYGAAVWEAFVAPSPVTLLRLWREREPAPLPHLRAAILRLLEEYPGSNDGVSRTSLQALRVASDGPVSAGQLFRASQSMEEDAFIGDSSFFRAVRVLVDAAQPAMTVTTPEGRDRYELTPFGREVVLGADFLARNDSARWIGGVHLQGRDTWRWDRSDRRLIAPDGRRY